MVFRLSIFLFFFFLSFYFFYHGIYGTRGYIVKKNYQSRLVALNKELHQLSEERDRLANNVALLQRDIDPDLLEQLAWRLFRSIDPHKKVLMLP